jgi:mechanosensitive ion channel-like protein
MWIQIQQALNKSTGRVITEIANLLPGIAALIVALLIAGLLAWIIAFLLRRSLRKIQFDERMTAWGFHGLAEWSPSSTPTLLITRTITWVILLIGFLVGISAFDVTLTSQFVERLFTYIPHVFAALILIFVGNIVARFLSRSVLIGAVNMNLQYARLLSAGVKWMVLVVTLAMALDHLAIGGRIVYLAFAILFGGIVLALSLAVGLGSKDIISRSLQREASRSNEEVESPFRHL